MKQSILHTSIIIVVLCIPVLRADINVTYDINTVADRAPISPYIYGTNWGYGDFYTIARSGGNRLTGYNWENNYSNAGEDWYNYSDTYLVRDLPWNQRTIPGRHLTDVHDNSLAAGRTSILTLQMAGYVSADDNGSVRESETAPSFRWKEVVPAKGAPFCDPFDQPDTTDGYVYMDECVSFLLNKYGDASTDTGIKFYCLDNEPALWSSTHPRIHPDATGCEELVDRTTALCSAVKDVDPHARMLGPVLYGFSAFVNFQSAPDWDKVSNGYNWFIDYYLDRMQKAEINQGRRLLDVLDVHWYPEAQGDGQRIVFGSPPYSRANIEARLQAPRTLWDPDYVEDSWIGTWFRRYLPLLPSLFHSINAYYPSTKLAITEYDYGAQNHYSGGIATADVLGIFGQYGVHIATYWGGGSDAHYVHAAFRMYRDYDGAQSTFGDTRVQAVMSDKVNSSIYGSMFQGNDTELHLLVINKNFDQAINGTFHIKGSQDYVQGRVWAFDDSSAAITEITPITSITDNVFSYNIPPLTVCHMVLQTQCPMSDLNNDCHFSEQVQTGMLQSMQFMRSIANHGGYAGIYSLDLNDIYGEGFYDEMSSENIWIQPPGTPSVGQAYLRAYQITGDEVYLEAATDVGRALAWVQRDAGGWDHQGDVSSLDPNATSWDRIHGQCTFDDDISQGALRFLMNLDNVISEPWLTESVQLGITYFLDSQYDNGAWPQWYPLRGGYHDYYTFNDNTINDCIGIMIKIHERYQDQIYLDSLRKGGDFMILSQIAAPQAGWAQQYDFDMQPAWARAYEPPAVCSAVTSRNIRTLVDLALYTRDEKYLQPIPAAITWLDNSNIGDNLWARFYELGTNVPIYGDRDGQIHYTLEEISEERRNGYSWQSSYGIKSNKNYYDEVANKGIESYLAEQAQPLTPQEQEDLLSQYAGKAQAVLASLDEQGRWLDSEGQWIYTGDFVKNFNTLCDYEELYRSMSTSITP